MIFSHQNDKKHTGNYSVWPTWSLLFLLLLKPIDLAAETVSFPDCVTFAKAFDVLSKQFDLSATTKPISSWTEDDFTAFDQFAIACYESGHTFNITDKRIFINYYLTDVTSSLRKKSSEAAKSIENERRIAELKSRFEKLDLDNTSQEIDQSLKELQGLLSKISRHELTDLGAYFDLQEKLDSAVQQRKKSMADSVAMTKLSTISKRIEQAPTSEQGLKSLDQIKKELRDRDFIVSDAASLQLTKLENRLHARKVEISESLWEQLCKATLAEKDYSSEYLDYKTGIPFGYITVRDLICAAEKSGNLVDYSEPSFFSSTLVVETKAVTLVFEEQESGGKNLILKRIKTSQGTSNPRDLKEAVLITEQVYVAMKAAISSH